ncbi:hypothetical protein ACLOJK_017619 [Asimina triloba]
MQSARKLMILDIILQASQSMLKLVIFSLGFGSSGFTGFRGLAKKQRSNSSRRPRPNANSFFGSLDGSTSSSTPPSDNVSKVSSDENMGYDTGLRRKEININSAASRVPSYNRVEGEKLLKKSRKDGAFGEYDGLYSSGNSRGGSSSRNEKGRNLSDLKRCSEGVLAPSNWKSTNKVNLEFQSESYNGGAKSIDSRSQGQSGITTAGSGSRGDSSSNENKLRKVKLKVGGVTRTIHAKSAPVSATDMPLHSSDAPRHKQRLILPDNSDDDQSPTNRTSNLQGGAWKSVSGEGVITLGLKAESRCKISGSLLSKQAEKYQTIPAAEPVRKSKRVPKRRVLDGAFDEKDEDDELRYLERLKTAKANAEYGIEHHDGEEDRKKHRLSKSSRSRVDEGEYEDADYIEEEEDDEPGSDGGFEADKRKRQRKESLDSLADTKKEISLTARQRALQGKDASAGASTKQKEKLSDVEQQLKKAEAAQRRRVQVEKAARESEAEAIRKILGQDSNRKKREDKLQKQRDELAREKAANAVAMAANTVRWVMGPTGTTVSFPKDLDFHVPFVKLVT